ncbi:tRNA (adenosine(37)-N6)-dimethylallyltransferase MiaA [Fulvimarina sp. 2208YS6-2-32]|uniref:tRNA dimethylallyltransferase n=1 Tax=Fulvimarina uroteuthidis TaxID=3098149 RepID=A0ABU5HZA0_9HYPH|nr:tRNA (adenosine(37)-N6)-dimethylallyltransferase MiaA [Fulvimarina sp. 2208YS6-2-32]MDY8108192.1 tRNA (adenosine(37)-N6)-dimethylallyltransferase MiaA [Fulvimarina sp. 2208YS6-2-32]
MDLALSAKGMVINADSLQVYRDLPTLTARPSLADEMSVPHALYGVLEAGDPVSAGSYVRMAGAILASCRQQGLRPIFCGGTGLYFKALLGLLDAMPPVPDAVRQKWRALLAEAGPEAMHAELARVDPAMAERLKPKDGQRIVRALEIAEASGTPLSRLQRGRGEGLLDPDRALKIVLTPERPILRERIARRFDAMLATGAMDEVQDYLARRPDGAGFVEKAIGFDELSAVLSGEATLDGARERAIIRTRQYAKRQDTWFRHQFDGHWTRHADADSAFEESRSAFE